MTARMAPKDFLTRVFLIERFDQLAHRIEDTLLELDGRVGFERATNVSSASEDLAYIDPDVVVVNVDEIEACEWETLTRMREAYPNLRFYGLSGNPDSKKDKPQSRDACDDYFPLVTSLGELKQQLAAGRAI